MTFPRITDYFHWDFRGYLVKLPPVKYYYSEHEQSHQKKSTDDYFPLCIIHILRITIKNQRTWIVRDLETRSAKRTEMLV